MVIDGLINGSPRNVTRDDDRRDPHAKTVERERPPVPV